MNQEHESIPTLGEAATRFLATLAAKKREASQPEVYKFARWYGWDNPFSRLAPPAVAGYAEQMSASDTDYQAKLGLVKEFLAFAGKHGWSRTNLSTHLKAKKARTVTVPGPRKIVRKSASLSRQRYDELAAEVADLKVRSQELVTEIQRAAADKDFRENAPLQAAREERGHVEGRIKELEEALKSATIIEEKKSTNKAVVGDSVTLEDLGLGGEVTYTIVDPREVDPSRGKISNASPLGKALLGRLEGDEVETTVPAGKLRYRIIKIGR